MPIFLLNKISQTLGGRWWRRGSAARFPSPTRLVMRLPHSFIVLLLAVLANAAITNTTIDDSNSSFTFTGTWNTITPTSPCTICSSKPDPSRTYGGTWHDGNIRDGAPVGTSGSFTFTGSAVYIFGIDQATSQPDIAFTLGSIQQVHHYTGTEQFAYDALFFSATGLASDQTYTVNWVFNVADTGVEVQAALFDYAIVTSGEADVQATSSGTTEPGPSQSTTSSNKATSTTRSSGSTGSSPTSSPTSSAAKSGQSESVASQLSNPASSSGNNPSSVSTGPGHLTQSSIVTVTTDSAGTMITVTAPAQLADSRSTSHSNLGAIIGGVVGAVAVVTLLILFLWLRRRRVRRVEPETDKVARSQFLRIEDYPLHSMQNALPRTDAREVATSVPITLAASGSKRYLGNNTSEAGLTGVSTTSLSYPTDGPATSPTHSDSSPRPPEIEPPPPPPPPAAVNPPSTEHLQFLEERVANLEAQVAINQHPPPYVHEDDD